MIRLLWFVVFVCIHQSLSEDVSSTTAKREDSNPVALLLSNLRSLVENPGELFEDSHEFFSQEDEQRKEPIYGKPRQDYFKRIKENYGKLRKNVGSVLEDLSLPKNLFGVDVKNKEGSSTIDVKVPFFPVHVKVKSTHPSIKEPVTRIPGFSEVFDKQKEDSTVKGSTKVKVSVPAVPIDIKVKSETEPVEPDSHGDDDLRSLIDERRLVRPSLSSVSTKVKVGDIKVKVDSKVVKRFGQSFSEWIDLGKSPASSRGKRDTSEIASEELKEVFSKTYYDFMSDPSPIEDVEDVEVDIIDPVRGRILGEMLYSEEAFDNMTKEAVRNLKWALDSNLDPSKILDKLDAVAKLVLSRPKPRTKTKRATDGVPPISNKDSSRLPTKPDEKQGPTATMEQHEYDTDLSHQEAVLLAITQGGVPVQIRIGPEVENPYKFLHKILSASEVVLKVQMNPTGVKEEVDEKEEIPAPALHVDLSDVKQRSSFLRTLRKFK